MGDKASIKAQDLPYRRCVGIVLFNNQGLVWAGRRLPNTESIQGNTKLWQMPQGGVDKGENLEKAARRELWEETGITSASLMGKTSSWLTYDLPDAMIGIGLKGKYRGQTQKWFAFKFDGEETEINISHPPDGSHPEFDAWEWKPLEEMPALIVPFKREVYERVVEEFAHMVGSHS